MNVSLAPQDTAQRELLIRRVDAEADGVLGLELAAPDGDPLPPWEPGAHLSLHLESGLVRQYSLCGDPFDRHTYRIAVLDDPHGRGGSREVHRTAALGGTITISGPRNNFTLRRSPRYLFIAGGIGITPILPMIRQAAREGAEWTLLYGGRSLGSMAFTDDLLSLGGSRVTLVPQDQQGLPDIAGSLSSAGAGTAVYCCGPPALISAVEQHCDAIGLAESLHVERFGPVSSAPSPRRPADVATIDLELRRSGTRLTVSADQSILQAVRSVVPAVSFSCEEGYCGTCETRVLDGVPDHRDTVLSDDERGRGDCMMICVSRAHTPVLALDL